MIVSEYALIGVSLLLGAVLYRYQSLRLKHRELEVRLEEQKNVHGELSSTFKALSHDALEKSNQSFLSLATESLAKFQSQAKHDLDKKQTSFEALVTPVKESLAKLDQGMQAIEKDRKGESSALKAHLATLIDSEQALRKETSSLVQALRAPTVRGRWGELQLRRVVELAGMVNHCDFHEQVSEGNARPDLVVHLPGEKQVIVDAKTPCEAYLDAVQTSSEEKRGELLQKHAEHVRSHIQTLGKKAYWEKFQEAPEFVVLFIPSDSFYSAALEYDPALIEVGVEQGVIIATPSTLIGLLRAIAYGWKQEALSLNAKEISELGHELYKRLSDLSAHWSKVGRSLSSSVDAYNKCVGTLESRVLVTARKFKDLGASRGELGNLEQVDHIPRAIQAAELSEN